MAIKIRKYCKFCRNSRTLSPKAHQHHWITWQEETKIHRQWIDKCDPILLLQCGYISITGTWQNLTPSG